MALWALPHFKYAVNLAVTRDIVNLKSIGLAAIYAAPSVDLEAPKKVFKKRLKLETLF